VTSGVADRRMMTDMATADPRDELRSIERSTGLTLDDPHAATVMAALRSAGIFDHRAWADALQRYETALLESVPAPAEEHDGMQVFQLSAMNEDWLRIQGTKERLTRELPDVAAWCLAPQWQRKAAFWRGIDKLLKGLGMKRAWTEVADAAVQAAHDLKWGAGDWEGRHDGFGEPKRPTRVLQRALVPPGAKCSILRRKLDVENYCLPDAAIYEAVRNGCAQPTVAILQLDGKYRSRFKDRDRMHVDSLRRWQAMLWDLYAVISLVEKGDIIDPFDRAESWGEGEPFPRLKDITKTIDRAVRAAVKKGELPIIKKGRGDSVATEEPLGRVLSGPLRDKHRLSRVDKWTTQAPGWCHDTDLAFADDEGRSLAIEVKVEENWDHPLGEPLACLLGYNAVVNVRMRHTDDRVEKKVRALITSAERELVDRGRAGFVYQPPL
jgi:hypothetical protein